MGERTICHQEREMLMKLEWIGTVFGILGAVIVALNIDISGYGFVLFLISSVSWAVVGLRERREALWTINLVFTFVSCLGIYRWLLSPSL